jgi:hypothetical protein
LRCFCVGTLVSNQQDPSSFIPQAKDNRIMDLSGF